MPQEYPKRLIEVDLPIKRISAHARREKSIRHGHISTLHIWWARRPLAACLAVTCAALWPDPVDDICPQAFRDQAVDIMLDFCQAAISNKEIAQICSEESWAKYQTLTKPENRLDPINPDHLSVLRGLLLDFIADFSAREASSHEIFLDTARSITKCAHEALGGIPGTRPLVVDPFAGGGAIPLEALRVGADAFASDLNPVAVLLNKVLLEYIPKYGNAEIQMQDAEGNDITFHGLADAVRYWGNWVKERAEKELAQFYPKDPDGATPIAYLWARTIQCEGPGCGAEVPLIRSLWLDKKSRKSIAVQMVPNSDEKRVDFEIIEKSGKKWHRRGTETLVSNPKFDGTVARGAATCPCCGYTTPVKSVCAQLRGRQGGAGDARLFVVVSVQAKEKGRCYRLANKNDSTSLKLAEDALESIKGESTNGLSSIPDENLPPKGTLGLRVQRYGMLKWGDLFSPRQLLALITLIKFVRESAELQAQEEKQSIVDAVQIGLIIGVSRTADHLNSGCSWNPSGPKLQHMYTRQAIPIVWDFYEANPFGGSVGDWMSAIECGQIAFNSAGYSYGEATVEKRDAGSHILPDDSAQVVLTDPPYYDAVPYADLSDFFYVWLRRGVPQQLRNTLLSENLTPKLEECVVDETKGHDKACFESKMLSAMTEGRRVLAPTGIGLVVFAHKSTMGWETQLQAMIEAGWIITASWPSDTEMASRLRARESAALASSIHLVCRPRENEDGSLRVDDIGDWREVLAELPGRIHVWMMRLQYEGVVGADAIFSCLGPALEIFSRYSKVEKANGEQVQLREYLEHVWAAVSKEALEQVFKGAHTSGFEEDARLTAMWLWTLGAGTNAEEGMLKGEGGKEKPVSSGGYTLEYDAARKIAQGLGAHLEQLNSLIEVKGDKARLLPVSERAGLLFGKGEMSIASTRGKKKKPKQMTFADIQADQDIDSASWGVAIEASETAGLKAGQTTLDRVHQAMLLFAAGRSEAVRRFLVEDGIGADSRFWQLAQALSALYPGSSEEKRWVDGLLARKKGLGF